jgi:hypothetical protein
MNIIQLIPKKQVLKTTHKDSKDWSNLNAKLNFLAAMTDTINVADQYAEVLKNVHTIQYTSPTGLKYEVSIKRI